MRSVVGSCVGVAVVAAVAAGCSSSSDDGKTVAGRTRSVSTAIDSPPVATARLRIGTRREQATGTALGHASARLTLAGAEAAVLRRPGDAEVDLVAGDAAGTFGVEVEGAPDEVAAAWPAGVYTFTARLQGGAHASVSLEAIGAPPPTPVVTAPTDLALVPAEDVRVAWTWDGTAGLFDVTFVDERGEVAYRAADLAGREHRVAPGALAPGRYRLEVTAATAEDDAAVRFEAAGTVLVDVTP